MCREDSSRSTTVTPEPGNEGIALEDVEHQLAVRLAGVIGVPTEEIETDRELQSYGLSSLDGLVLLGDLENWLGFEVPPSALADYPTLKDLAGHLLERLSLERGGA